MMVKILFLIFVSISFFSQFSMAKNRSNIPVPGDASIDEAVRRFSIRVPEESVIMFNKGRKERAITMTSSREGGKGAFVILGPGAFTSWALLGSTLAHELEVHAHQDIPGAQKLTELDLPGGIYQMEIDAYHYEINQRQRFGTSDYEVENYMRAWLKEYNKLENEVWDRFQTKIFFVMSRGNSFSAFVYERN